MLGDGGACRRGDERRRGRDVERPAAVAAGAAGVDDVGNLVRHGAHPRPHRLDGAGDLVGAFALHRQRDEQRRDLALGELTVHDPAEERRHLVSPEVFTVEQALQEVRCRAHSAVARGSAHRARKFATIRGPATVKTDSGWNWTPQ